VDDQQAGEPVRIRGQRPDIHSSEYINAHRQPATPASPSATRRHAAGEKRAEEAKNSVEVAYFIPREGALMWFDSFAIPADAKNVAEAHAFIDYMMRPEVAARNTNFVSYASGILSAREKVAPES
jgi:putrescine transport system substrate-binding protein